MTQDGASKLVENTLKAKEEAGGWRRVALVLAEALAVLDFNDIGADVEPYVSASEILDRVKDNKLDETLFIIRKR